MTQRKPSHPGHDDPVVIFQGGGYDGCFWEWNAIFFTRDPVTKRLAINPVQAAVTGRSGRAVLEAFHRGIRQGFETAIAKSSRENPFRINTIARWEEFQKEFNPGFIRSVAKHGQWDIKCQGCKNYFPHYEVFHTKYGGDGGVGIEFHDVVCSECADSQHDQWVARDIWPGLRKKERIEAVKKAIERGMDIDLSAAEQDECPVPGDCVYENQLY